MMTDEKSQSSDPVKDRLAEALAREATRRFEVYPTRDEASIVADFHWRIAAPGDRQQGVRVGIPSVGTKGIFGKHIRRPAVGTRSIRNIAAALGLTSAVIGLAFFVVGVHPAPVPSTSHSYSTTAGHRATVTLRDHWRIDLAPATTVNVVTTGEAGTTVTVTGEALFTIAHHAMQPFAVRAGGVLTRVLGTQFVVRRYPTDSMTRVIVVDGRVSVRNRSLTQGRAPLTLSAGMLGMVTDSDDVTVTPHIAVDDYTVLTANRLVFRATPVSDVITVLGRTYDVDIHIADTALAGHRMTMTIPVPQRSIDDVLALMTTTLNARYVRHGRVVTISPGRPVRHVPRTTFTPETRYGQ